MTFKKGDKVYRLPQHRTSSFVMGRPYIVKEVSSDGEKILLDGVRSFWAAYKFELAKSKRSHLPVWW